MKKTLPRDRPLNFHGRENDTFGVSTINKTFQNRTKNINEYLPWTVLLRRSQRHHFKTQPKNMKENEIISFTSTRNFSGENGAYDAVLFFLRQTELEVPLLALSVQL